MKYNLVLVFLIVFATTSYSQHSKSVFKKTSFYSGFGLNFYPIRSAYNGTLGLDNLIDNFGVEFSANGFLNLSGQGQLPIIDIWYGVSYKLAKGKLILAYTIPNLNLYQVELVDRRFRDESYFQLKQREIRDAYSISYAFKLKPRIIAKASIVILDKIKYPLPTATFIYTFNE